MSTVYLTIEEKRLVAENPSSHGVEWPTRKNKNLAMSFTKIEKFDQCPRAYNAIYVAQTAKDGGDRTALDWGNEVHSALEHYVLGGVALPTKMKQFQAVADSIIRVAEKAHAEGRLDIPIFGERQWAIGLDGKYREWFDKDVWIRGKADVGWASLTRLYLYDYKTGKGKYPKPEQLELLALLAVGQPTLGHIREVLGMLLFIEAGTGVKERTNTTSGADWLELLVKWQTKTMRMLDYVERDYWPERESPLCAWCPDLSCPFNKKADV